MFFIFFLLKLKKKLKMSGKIMKNIRKDLMIWCLNNNKINNNHQQKKENIKRKNRILHNTKILLINL